MTQTFYQQNLVNERYASSFDIKHNDIDWNDDVSFFVNGMNDDYLVSFDIDEYPQGYCNCPDFRYRVGDQGLKCKHIYAVERHRASDVYDIKKKLETEKEVMNKESKTQQEANQEVFVSGRFLAAVALPATLNQVTDIIDTMTLAYGEQVYLVPGDVNGTNALLIVARKN